MSREWQNYIKRQNDAQKQMLIKVIGQLAADEAEQRLKADAAINAKLDAIMTRLDKFETEVAELKSAALRRSNKSTTPDEDRKRAGEIRRSEQVIARARAA